MDKYEFANRMYQAVYDDYPLIRITSFEELNNHCNGFTYIQRIADEFGIELTPELTTDLVDAFDYIVMPRECTGD